MTSHAARLPARILSELPALAELAAALLRKQRDPGSVRVVVFAGAGASMSVGLPNLEGLAMAVHGRLTASGRNGIDLVLQAEAAQYGMNTPFGELDPLLQMEVFSRIAYGRAALRYVIAERLAAPRCRPLAYELLAHLAKHHFIDHFVSLNFDHLLDEALRDEIGDRISAIVGPQHVPGAGFFRPENPCFLVKPFGSISEDNYKVEPRDLNAFGAGTVWDFTLQNVFLREAAPPETVLLLVGYAAKEQAFARLLNALKATHRDVRIFAIDTGDAVLANIGPVDTATRWTKSQIRIECDLAFDLLLQMLRIRLDSEGLSSAWVPVARHHVVSVIPHGRLTSDSDRFRIEVLLQAIKSRGFFTLEAIDKVRRIRDHSKEAHHVLASLCGDGILTREGVWQNYAIKVSNGRLATELLKACRIDPASERDRWTVGVQNGTWKAALDTESLQTFVERCFDEIARAPEIEVDAIANPSTLWLFRHPTPLNSVGELLKATTRFFEEALRDARHGLIIHGVWTTGEWLFHEEGWAWQHIGRELVERASNGRLTLSLSLVLAKNPLGDTQRQRRGAEVVDRVTRLASLAGSPGPAPVEPPIVQIEWHKQNRVMTMLKWIDGAGTEHRKGIYMRRRLATPLVAPISVEGADCNVLDDVMQQYRKKGRAAPV